MMNCRYLYYIESAAFNSVNHNHRSIRAGKLPHIRLTNGPNRMQAASADITASLNYDENRLFFLMFLHLCKCSPDLKVSLKCQLRSESVFAASGAAVLQQLLQRQHALPWLITQNHLYSPPLTFHLSLYH